ncbi:MAG: DedA family protein [Verrucomicrobiota bacterium]
MHALFDQLIGWYQGVLEFGGYPVIVLLMFIESTFIPLPSELVIPFAADLAYTKGNLSLPGIVIAGAMGSWAGAMAMYWVARWAGRPLVMRHGNKLFVPPDKVARVERWASHYGSFGIFASRLLPVVRHLIGIPAGIVRMNCWKFSLHTLLGSAVWCAVLCWIGVKFPNDLKHSEDVAKTAGVWIGGAMLMLGLVYYAFVHRFMQTEKK